MSEIAQPSILVELKSIAVSGGTQQGKGYCMATLKARYVQRSRKRFTCDWCERGIAGAYVYLYGSAEDIV